MGNSSYFRFADDKTCEMGKLKHDNPTLYTGLLREYALAYSHTRQIYIWQAFDKFNVFK